MSCRLAECFGRRWIRPELLRKIWTGDTELSRVQRPFERVRSLREPLKAQKTQLRWVSVV